MRAGPAESDFLVIDKVSRHFGGLAALSEVSFRVGPGEIVGLIGPNGAGKTTLFSIISGALRPSSGRVKFQGRDIAGCGYDGACRLGVVRTHQIPRPFRNLTVAENVKIGAVFGGRRRAGESVAKKVQRSLEWLRLAGKAFRLAAELTGPELKALEVARALAADPLVLLLDEVVAGLNPTETNTMMEVIRRVNASGVTVLMVEHVMKAVMGVSHRVIMLHHGEKIAEGLPSQVARDPAAIKAYFGTAAVGTPQNGGSHAVDC